MPAGYEKISWEIWANQKWKNTERIIIDNFFLSELSNTRNELDKAKVQLEEARQRIVNLTPKETQRHEVHANDYKNDANNK